MIDQYYSNNISTRKLVIETAKFNVITAYSSLEAIETFEKYPALDGIVLDAGMKDMPCDELVVRFKQIRSDVPIIVVTGPSGSSCPQANYHLESFEPSRLLALLQTLRPDETARIKQQEQ